MTTNNRPHAAYNLTTGEVLMANNVRWLKSAIRSTNIYNETNYKIKSKWVFAHGRDYQKKLIAKIGKCW